MKTRSEISKKAWRMRKRLQLYKAKCYFCHKGIWGKGLLDPKTGRTYHKGCFEAMKIGLKPKHIGRNPVDFESFAAYYGGGDVKWLREAAEREKDPEYKEMFLKLAKLKEQGAVYVPGEGGQLWYKRIKNPKRALRDGFRFYGAKALNPRHLKSKGNCSFCHHPVYSGGSRYKNRTYHETCLLMAKKGVPSAVMVNPVIRCIRCGRFMKLVEENYPRDQSVYSCPKGHYKCTLEEAYRNNAVVKNPGAAWHEDRAAMYRSEKKNSSLYNLYQRLADEQDAMVHFSKKAGIPNPRNVIDKRGIEYGVIPFGSKGIMVGREDSLPLEYTTPFIKGMKTAKIENPRAKCPKCGEFLYLTAKQSPETYKYPHGRRYICKKCNKGFWSFEVREFNPEARPPREWMAEIIPGLKSSYPAATREQLGRLAAGIWWKWTPGQREHYRVSHGTAVANPKYEVYGRFKGLPMETELTHTIVTAKNKKEAESKGKKIIERIIGGDAVVSASKLDNPLLRGEVYLGRTKRGVSVSEAKRKGYL